MTTRGKDGFTLLEVMVVMAIIGVLAALAVPSMRTWMADSRVRATARTVADAFHVARAEAVRTGHNHVVLLGEDIDGNDLEDVNGNPLVIVLDDGEPETADCEIGVTEVQRAFPFEDDVVFGASGTTTKAAVDAGAGAIPVTFTEPGTTAETRWVVFGPDGVPVGAEDDCTLGRLGTGGGAVYVTNGRVDYVVALSRLGAVRASGFEKGAAAWQ